MCNTGACLNYAVDSDEHSVVVTTLNDVCFFL